MRQRFSRKRFDDWFYTIAHYAGLGLLFYAVFVDKFHNPAILPAAMGLIFLRTVAGNGYRE